MREYTLILNEAEAIAFLDFITSQDEEYASYLEGCLEAELRNMPSAIPADIMAVAQNYAQLQADFKSLLTKAAEFQRAVDAVK